MARVKDASSGDLVLTNANVITLNPQRPKAGGVIIAKGRIRSLQPADAVTLRRGAGVRIIDCRGKTLLPGFIDGHFHLHGLAESLVSLDLGPGSRLRCISDIQSKIRKFAGRVPRGGWIRAKGYNEFYLAEKRHPNRWDLDAAVADHPVKLTHRSGHAHVLNSRALELIGVSKTTPDPPRGMIERDLATGEPTGLLFEMGDFLAKRIPFLQTQELEEGIRTADQKLLSLGITSIQDASAGNDARRWNLFCSWKQRGLLKTRISMMLGPEGFGQRGAAGFATSPSPDQLRLNGVKIILDETTGRLIPSQDELNRLVLKIHRAGTQVAIHAIEENAVQSACRAIGFALKKIPRPDHRHRIEHCSVCPPFLSKQLAALGVMVVTQPAFVYFHGDRYLQTVAAEQLPNLYPIATLFKEGVMVAGSSDCPIVPPDPLIGIYSATARRSSTGRPVSANEGIGCLVALQMYTQSAALAGFEEMHKGSIAPGKLADLVLLNGDPLKLPVDEIKDLEVEMTVLDGKIVWNKNHQL